MNQKQVLHHVRQSKNTAVVVFEQRGKQVELRLNIMAVGICYAEPILIIEASDYSEVLPAVVNVADLGQVRAMKVSIMPTEGLQSAIDFRNRNCPLAMRVTEVVPVEEPAGDQFQKAFEQTMATLAEVSESQKQIIASQKSMIDNNRALIETLTEMVASEKAFQATMAEFLKSMEK
jgi:hypothetical protein